MEPTPTNAKTLPEAVMFAKQFKILGSPGESPYEFFSKVSDEAVARETATGRNSGIYLLGHLVAVNDGMFPLLGFRKTLPTVEVPFIKSPDKSGLEYPSVDELKRYWNDVHEKLSSHFRDMSPREWLSKHEAVSNDDFAKEPFRNKLNVVVSRTTHMSYHLGQLVYLKERGK